MALLQSRVVYARPSPKELGLTAGLAQCLSAYPKAPGRACRHADCCCQGSLGGTPLQFLHLFGRNQPECIQPLRQRERASSAFVKRPAGQEPSPSFNARLYCATRPRMTDCVIWARQGGCEEPFPRQCQACLPRVR